MALTDTLDLVLSGGGNLLADDPVSYLWPEVVDAIFPVWHLAERELPNGDMREATSLLIAFNRDSVLFYQFSIGTG